MYQNINYNFQLLLEENDEVYLELASDDYLYAVDNYRLTISGELISLIV